MASPMYLETDKFLCILKPQKCRSSFHRLDMTLAVAEALNPSKPKPEPVCLVTIGELQNAKLRRKKFIFAFHFLQGTKTISVSAVNSTVLSFMI